MAKNWSIKEILEWTTRYFSDKRIDSPRIEAEVLLASVLKKDRVYLYGNYDSPVNRIEREEYRQLIKRRVNGEPTAYITGYKEFMSLKFIVNPGVLIPRPDTEIMVEKVIEIIGQKKGIKICDVGTGSGAIAVSLSHYMPEVEIIATDLSESALKTARSNAALHGVEIMFFQGDLLTPVLREGPFDVITANLPYISPNEYAKLDKEVKCFEPVDALIAAGDGLDIYRRLLPQALKVMGPGAYLLIEIAYNQGKKALEMAASFRDVKIIKDMAGRDRILIARKG